MPVLKNNNNLKLYKIEVLSTRANKNYPGYITKICRGIFIPAVLPRKVVISYVPNSCRLQCFLLYIEGYMKATLLLSLRILS